MIEQFKEMLIDLDISMCVINVEIADIAAQLRSRYKLKAMDVVQVAASNYLGCDRMVTNDKDLSSKVKDTQFLIIEDWVDQTVH